MNCNTYNIEEFFPIVSRQNKYRSSEIYVKHLVSDIHHQHRFYRFEVSKVGEQMSSEKCNFDRVKDRHRNFFLDQSLSYRLLVITVQILPTITRSIIPKS